MASRRKSYIDNGSVNVIFDGSKSFWKTRTSLNVLIAIHDSKLCVEIVTYDPTIGVEGNRIYALLPALKNSVNQDEFNRKLNSKKEAILRQHKTVVKDELSKEIMNELIISLILARLNMTNTENGGFSVCLMPISSDIVKEEDPSVLQFIIDCPNGLTPIQVCYQKNVSAKEMKNALNALNSEKLALQNATKMAEMVTSSVDGFKLMLAEKMRLEKELKSMYSETRLRWINAINRVLIQNYIDKVKERLLNSNIREWYIHIMEAAEEFNNNHNEEEDDTSTLGDPLLVPKGATATPKRSKDLRRSIDNSQLPNLNSTSTENITKSNHPSSGHNSPSIMLPRLNSNNSNKFASPTNQMERRRIAKSKHGQNGRNRRSFDSVTKTNSEKISKLRNQGSSGKIQPLLEKPPSLLESFAESAPKLETPVSLSSFGESSKSRSRKLLAAR